MKHILDFTNYIILESKEIGKIYYHGTNKEIGDELKGGMITDNYDEAVKFAKMKVKRDGGKPMIYEVENPIIKREYPIETIKRGKIGSYYDIEGTPKVRFIEQLYESSTNKIYYHGTNVKFNKFHKKKFGTGEGSNMLGEGIYLATNLKKAKEYGKIILKVKLLGDPKIINYDQIKYEDGYYPFLDRYKGDRMNAKEAYARKHFDGMSYGSDQIVIFDPKGVEIVG